MNRWMTEFKQGMYATQLTNFKKKQKTEKNKTAVFDLFLKHPFPLHKEFEASY